MQSRFLIQKQAKGESHAVIDCLNGLPVSVLGRHLIGLPQDMAEDVRRTMEDVAVPRAPQAGVADRPAPFSMLSPQARHERSEQLLCAGLSDVARWTDLRNLAHAWDARAAALAPLIDAPDRVLDLGCGAMALERALRPGVVYMPADLVRRDERTLVFDVNAGPLPDADADVVTGLGFLEYVQAPDAFFAAARRWPRLILTYNPADLDMGRDRRSHGWFNDLTVADVVAIAVTAGFSLVALIPFDARQRIFDFQRAV